jgi:protein SCO1
MLVGCAPTPSHKKTESHPDLDYPVGSFSLTERSGRTVTEKDLLGKVWIASFVFTRCTGTCPQITATVTKLQHDEQLKSEPDLRFVTFTVDPARDDLNSLRDYAKSRNADSDRSLFLTGDEAAIHALLKERFKQAVGRKEGVDVKPGDEFDHSTNLMLVDRKGIIRDKFEGMPSPTMPDANERFESNLRRLKEQAIALCREK